MRPDTITAIDLNLGSNHYRPLYQQNAGWYRGQSLPAMTADHPSDYFYNPTFPNGELYFWPVPTAALAVRIQTPLPLVSVALTDDWELPYGYDAALTASLKERLMAMPMFSSAASPDVTREAMIARATVFGAHKMPPRLMTKDYGMPGRSGGWWDYRIGDYR